jgi:hypothetical protein
MNFLKGMNCMKVGRLGFGFTGWDGDSQYRSQQRKRPSAMHILWKLKMNETMEQGVNVVALNFTMFVDKVESGEKRQTIRANTKATSGCNLTLYEGMRTKKCRKLGEAKCVSVQKVTLMETLVQPQGNCVIGGMFLDGFAKADGFKTYADMWAFFKPRANEHGEFHGFLVRW